MVRGFAAAGLEAAGAVLTAAVGTHVLPGAVAAVGTGRSVQARWVLGDAETGPGGSRGMTEDTLFDLASLTKVLVTLPAVLTLVDQGRLRLEDRIRRHVPGVAPAVTVAHALTHTAGLAATRDFTASVTTTAELVAAAAAEPLERPAGTRVEYSDLGFVLLGGLVEQVDGRPLDVVAEVLLASLGSGVVFRPLPALAYRTAATEVLPTPVGGPRALVGRVHDENAAAAGGVSGHAGAFGTLADVVAVVQAWSAGAGTGGGALLPPQLLSPQLRARAFRDATVGLGGHRGLGWTARGDGHDILEAGWGPAAVSHTGFTGTSTALDPLSGRWAVLLTNAVHFGRDRPGVQAARRDFHAALTRV